MWRRQYLALAGATFLAGCADEDGGGDGADESMPTHAVGEIFTVGSGDARVEYAVAKVRTAPAIGGQYGVTADGEFVIVTLSLANRATESFRLSSSVFTLTDDQGRSYDVDTEAMIHADDPILFEQVGPDVQMSGTIIFDVPENQSGRALEIEPAGFMSNAATHAVELP